ncbi:hypothetical protein [uncultured Zobellia sp.]|uniref:hypothetical protein n=1 Tax=uncultured Zobellia sp. TaxID=255433 RepID=UPI0025964903|nr:hypothetical protein [uncultured Zobellia sp.]
MNKLVLAEIGKELADELESLSEKFHVKSDHHEILLWEVHIIKVRVKDLIENSGIQNKLLKESVLVSQWGDSLSLIPNEIITKVKDFHSNYNELKNPNL